MCNEDSVDLKGAIKKLSDVNYDELLKEARTYLARTQAGLSVKERNTQELESSCNDINLRLEKVKQEISTVPKEVTEYKDSKDKIKKCQETLISLEKNNSNKHEQLEENLSLLEKIEVFLKSFDINFFNGQKDFINEKQTELLEMSSKIVSFEEKKKEIDNKIDSLKKAPCSFSLKDRCHFVKDASYALKDARRVEIELNQLSLFQETLNKKIYDMNPDKVSKYISKYYEVLEKRSSLKESISDLELEIEKDKVKILQLRNISKDLNKSQHLFEENIKSIEVLQSLQETKSSLDSDKLLVEKELNKLRKEILDLYKNVGSLEQRHEELTNQKENFISLQEEYTTADLFLKCMHPNGISYDIIKRRLPLINSEISKILTNIVEFEIFFENEESKLDILIKHPRHDPRPIELGSGAEKTIAAMAIRLALLNVSTLPKGDVFILDEPGTALDAENMEGFVRILEMIKSQFKTVMLISHLDSLKDIVDQEIAIEKNNGRAYVNE